MRFLFSSVFVVAAAFIGSVSCDLRMASHPDNAWKTISRGNVQFVNPTALYMEPSAFGFQGLEKQRKHAYDNFLRSNIDNEHNRRHFAVEPGRDMLPFRSFEGGFQDFTTFSPVNTAGSSSYLTTAPPVVPGATNVPSFTPSNPTDILNQLPKFGAFDGPFATAPGPAITVTPGVPFTVPLRWNNPHSSELEINVWIKTTATLADGAAGPGVVVVPIKKPACSGEGHQDNVFAFTIPQSFLQLPAAIPGFTGCNVPGDCVLQMYAQSVESRQYSAGVPLVVPGTYVATTTSTTGQIAAAPIDVGTDVAKLPRDICLPSNDAAANIVNVAAQWPRLISDEFTHAYYSANNPYSPYSGQQPLDISRNMQYSCLNRMITGNRGELGKSLLSSQNRTLLNNAATKEAGLVKKMEGIVNNIINNLLQNVLAPTSAPGASDGYTGLKTAATTLANTLNATARTGTLQAANQAINSCFRCSQVGSTTTHRLETNTYVPSFNIPPTAVDANGKNLLTQAAALAANAGYPQLVDTTTGNVLIYKTVYNLMAADYNILARTGFFYQTAAIKPAMTTLVAAPAGVADPKFLKVDAAGKRDHGVYAATQAYKWLATSAVAAFKIPGTQWNPVVFTGTSQSNQFGVMANAEPTVVPVDPCSNDTEESKAASNNYYVPYTGAAASGCSPSAMDPAGLTNDGNTDKLVESATTAVANDAPSTLGTQGLIQFFCDPLLTSVPCAPNSDADNGGALTVQGLQLDQNIGAAHTNIVNGLSISFTIVITLLFNMMFQ